MLSYAADASGLTVQPLVRTARRADVDDLFRFACSGGTGLTNLPPDRDALAAKLAASEEAIASLGARERGSAIWLIAEAEGRVVGTSCIFPRVGADWPFYSYRLTGQVARSLAVGRRKAQTLLNLVNDFDGECEVGGLFVDPDCRGHSIGLLAARARYLFIAIHRDWFGQRVIAELRGYQDENGRSPVWEAIGRNFYDMEFNEADRTGALSGNQFIADLGPRYPLYVSLLPQSAQDALGRPHDDGRPAVKMLLAEGFSAGDYIDIFDGGPTLVADIDAVRTVRNCRAAQVSRIAQANEGMAPSFVAKGREADFQLCRGPVGFDGSISQELADTLELGVGDPFHYTPVQQELS